MFIILQLILHFCLWILYIDSTFRFCFVLFWSFCVLKLTTFTYSGTRSCPPTSITTLGSFTFILLCPYLRLGFSNLVSKTGGLPRNWIIHILDLGSWDLFQRIDSETPPRIRHFYFDLFMEGWSDLFDFSLKRKTDSMSECNSCPHGNFIF